jgi:hypothetical protein
MAVMIPPVLPATAPPGEREVFRRLANDPDTEDWIVLHSLDIPEHISQVAGEADFVIIVPSKGVAVIEVKSHTLIRRDENGLWRYGKDTTVEERGPFRQSSDAMHSIRKRLIKKRPDFSRVVFWSGVVIPRASVRVNSDAEWHPWQLIDAAKFRGTSISKLITGLLRNAHNHLASCNLPWYSAASQEPYPEQCRAIAEILRPTFEAHQSPAARSRILEEDLRVYTGEQMAFLDQLQANPRLLVRGAAGTGKTILAVETARRSSEAGLKVALLCFNRLLGMNLSGMVRGSNRLYASTLHKLMLDVSDTKPPDGVKSDPQFWSEQLPQDACNALLERDDEKWLFDELILDEFQDMQQQPILDFLDLILKGGLAAGRWRAFGDFARQSIYSPSNKSSGVENCLGNPAICLLTANCRNTPRVAEYIRQLGQLVPFYEKILRPDDGVDPELLSYTGASEQARVLRQTIVEFREEGYKSRDIVVLSPRKHGAPSELADTGSALRLEPYPASGNTACGWTTIHAFKGLEAPVVILADFDHVSTAERADLFYIGITRALQRLVILLGPSARKEIAAMLT